MCEALSQARELASEGKDVEHIDLAVGSSAIEGPRQKFRYSLCGTRKNDLSHRISLMENNQFVKRYKDFH